MKLAMFSDVLNLAAKRADSTPDLPAIHFQFGFAGSSRTNAAAQAGEVCIVPSQAAETVIQLRQLHLQLAFFGASSPGKNIENQTGAVHYFCLERFF